MNIIFIKQALNVKVNKRDTQKALIDGIEKLFNTDIDDIETLVLNTSNIKDIPAGASIIVASTKDLEKYAIISLGASTKDVWCITDNGVDSTYSFEYVMTVDKNVFNGIHVKDTLKEMETNKVLAEAVKMMGVVANTARYDTLISGRYGQATSAEDNIYGGLVVIDCRDDSNNDIDLDVVGRKGKLHLLRVVPVLPGEYEVVKYIDDMTMTEITALAVIKDNKGDFSNRTESFNFSPVLPVDTLTEEDIKQLGLKKDKDGKVIISTVSELKEFMDKKF